MAKPLPFAFLAAVLHFFLFAILGAAEKDPLGEETIGGLKLGQPAGVVVTRLGQPERKGKEVCWEATGDWVVNWKFPKQGLELNLASGAKGGPKKILSILAQAPCPLATGRGVKVGSTEAEVRKAYGPWEEKTESKPGETFVAGSIYGGIIFSFQAGRVRRIFFGAAAE